MGKITSQSCTWTPCFQCYVLLRTLKTHGWVGMQFSSSNKKKVLRNTSTTSDPHDNGGNKKPILYLDPLLSVLSAMEDTGDTWLGGYPVEVKFIKYLSLIPFATFQVILFQRSYLMGCLCVNIWQLYAIMTIQKSDQK